MNSKSAGLTLSILLFPFCIGGVAAQELEREVLLHKEVETHTLGFTIGVEAAGDHWEGQLSMNYEKWLNGSTLLLSSSFESDLPESIPLPAQEEVREDNGVVFSQILNDTSEQGESVVRMHEYGTFTDLGALVGKLAEQGSDRRVAGNGRLYQSGFLLLDKPASVRGVTVETADGYRQFDLAMSDNSVISYRLDAKTHLHSIQVQRDEVTVTYTVISSE